MASGKLSTKILAVNDRMLVTSSKIRPITHRMSRSIGITYQNVSPLPLLLFRIGIHQRAVHALVGNAALSRGALEKRH